jgi:RNA polymerase subunit RPABC4/transcription elongation factor Spt4
MSQIKCKNCYAINDRQASNCISCTITLSEDMIISIGINEQIVDPTKESSLASQTSFCWNCGLDVVSDATICQGCGINQPAHPPFVNSQGRVRTIKKSENNTSNNQAQWHKKGNTK